MRCPGYQRRHNTDEIMKSSFSYHRNCLLWTLRICHLVNGSLVIFQPSPVVPTKVVPLASPAISTGPPVRSNARCNPANNITICPTAQKFGRYFRSFTSFRKRVNNFAQSVKRFDKRYSIKYVLSNRLVLYCQTTWQSPRAIWQVKLVTDSLGNSACAESGHRQTFKHQTCCLGWFNGMRLWTLRSREGQISMTCWNHLYHATQIVCFAGLAFVIWSMGHLSSPSLLQWFRQRWCHMQVLQFQSLIWYG